MKNKYLQHLTEYLKVVTQMDRTIYFRCRECDDIKALARGTASLLPGKARFYLHNEPSLPEHLQQQLIEPLCHGLTVIFGHEGNYELPVQLAKKWDAFPFKPTPESPKPGLLVLLHIFDDEDPVPYAGSTRWIFEDEIREIEDLGRSLT